MDLANVSSRVLRRRSSHFDGNKIAAILKQLKSGRKVTELSREFGVSRATLYVWKAKYDTQNSRHSHRVQELEKENRKLKQLIGEKYLEIGKPLRILRGAAGQ